MIIAGKIKTIIYLPVFGAIFPLLIWGMLNGDWQMARISCLVGGLVIGLPVGVFLYLYLNNKGGRFGEKGWLSLSIGWPIVFLIPGISSLSAELHGPVFGWVVIPGSISVLVVTMFRCVLDANEKEEQGSGQQPPDSPKLKPE